MMALYWTAVAVGFIALGINVALKRADDKRTEFARVTDQEWWGSE